VVSVDGARVTPETVRWVAAGDHAIEIRSAGETVRRTVHAAPGAFIALGPAAHPDAATREAPKQRAGSPSGGDGTSPVWFWGGIGLTGALMAATMISGVQTANLHADFARNPTADAASSGEAAQTRTNVFLGLSLVSAAATAALGIFVVRWRTGASQGRGAVGPSGVVIANDFF
jgi:hypothetical protein